VSCLSNKPPCSSGEVVPAGGGGGGGVSVQEGCCVVSEGGGGGGGCSSQLLRQCTSQDPFASGTRVTPCTETTRIPVTLKNADLPTNKTDLFLALDAAAETFPSAKDLLRVGEKIDGLLRWSQD
ncbi:Thiamine-phosphate synthase, partial [Dissostichus eleginoides]